MGGERLKVIIKWALILVILGLILQFIAAFIVGLFIGLSAQNFSRETTLLIASIVGMLLLLPFAYYFSYKAVVEYLSGGPNRFQKNIGISIALGVVFLAALLGGGVNYLFTGNFNISAGLLPLLLGLVSGRKAEAKFVKK